MHSIPRDLVPKSRPHSITKVMCEHRSSSNKVTRKQRKEENLIKREGKRPPGKEETSMKNFKRIFALIIATVMIFSMANISSMAAVVPEAGSFDPTLTINGTDTGDIISFYKIVEWVESDNDAVRGWKAISPYNTILTKDVLTEVLLGTPATQADVDAGDATEVGQLINPTGITSEIGGKLAKLATSPVQSSTSNTLDVTPNTLGPGVYMAIVTAADADTAYNPAFVSSDFTKDNPAISMSADTYTDATVKKSDSHLDKEPKTSEEVWADGKWNTVAIGEEVTFTAKTRIPGYGDIYQNPYFAVNDKMTDLALDVSSVTVTEPAGLTKGTEYTVTGSDSGYTLVFKSNYLKTIKAPTDVTITYKAIVSTSAPVQINTEKNEISTVFSHIPTSENDYAFKKDVTNHYTFSIDADGLGKNSEQEGYKTSEIVKVGQNPDGSPITSEKVYSEVYDREYYQGPLEEAEFKLYTDSACDNEYIPKDEDGNELSPFALTSGSDGRFEIKGLDAGTYYLKETKAPAGYIKDTKIHEIVIEADIDEHVKVTEWTKDGVDWISADDYAALSADEQAGYKSYEFETEVLNSYTITIDGKKTAHYDFSRNGTDAEIKWNVDPDSPYENPFEIVNTKGVELPSTGGIGTTIFYIVGAILVLGAGVVLVTRRRMSVH